MSLNVSRTRLENAMKELLVHWERAQTRWDDQMSRKFESQHLRPLEPKVRNAVAAMAKMSEILAAVERECG